MKGHNENHLDNTSHLIPSELMEQISSLKKQNANSTYELLKTKRVIQEFKDKLTELENRINKLSPDNNIINTEQNIIAKLRDLQRFLD